MSSFLVLREGDNRNKGGVMDKCVQMLDKELWRLGRRKKKKKRERSPALDGEKGKCPALDRESVRGEPWLEQTGRER
ncbi:hypothetical protein TNCV_4414111 [Trichonephila clavipes]|uniref:Uncharacterized protein n=1 Tax=Trichonephila clavipes TaxID=2585209 RepID=A0A8X6SC67_TRICX|nr:hypothetical protein TNCV_4414111 [Trichonephila clavipes]